MKTTLNAATCLTATAPSALSGPTSAGHYPEDLAMMREYGLDAANSLFSCARHAADALGLSHLIGTIEPGKLADIVGDRLADTFALEKVDPVIQPDHAKAAGRHHSVKFGVDANTI